MDHYDCFVHDSDLARGSLPSPGLSSGYCSADESLQQQQQPKLSASTTVYRDLDSAWGLSQSPYMVQSADPCLGGVGGSGDSFTALASLAKGDSLPEIKCTSSFDDLMENISDPLGMEVLPRMADFPSCETIADVEMAESDSSSASSKGWSLADGGAAAMPSVGSESSLLNLLKSQDCQAQPGSSRAGFALGPDSNSGVFGRNQPGNGAAARQVPVRTGSMMSQQRAPSVVISKENGFCQTVSSLHQHMASMTDMSVGGDETDYIFQSVHEGSRLAHMDAAAATAPLSYVDSRTQIPTQTILGGVFGQRNAVVTSLRSCESKAFTRTKGGAVASSCGTLLRHSVTIPNSMNTFSAAGAVKSEPGAKQRTIPASARSGAKVMTSCDVKGGRATAAFPGMEDHRYTLQHMPGQPSTSSRASASKSNKSSASAAAAIAGSTSILEAFLRSTRHMDPNKGSNAALAAEGLLHLSLEERRQKQRQAASSESAGPPGLLLKKLLTGEIDQAQLERGGGEEERAIASAARVHDRLLCPSLPIDSPLTDGFGLDVDLALDDAAQMMGIGMMGPDVPDIADSVWLGDLSDELVVTELDEILREQTRQEDLWMECYYDKPV